MAYIKEYWQNKEQRAETARKHTKEMQNKYSRCIQTSILGTKIYNTNSFNRDFEEDIEDKDTKIVVENIDSVGAVMKYGNPSTAVLNFSSYKNSGGMFLNGSKAQEECLCHESFLYNVLSQFVLEFYDWNNRHKNKALYLNRGLFSPGVWFFRENSHVECSVITCAAPNKSAAQKYQNVSDQENTKVLRSRIKFVLDIAKDNNVSFVFENVDMKNDPHIIEYHESKLYLLDIVYNQMDFAKYEYETMCDIAHQFGLTPKEKAFEIANWQDFYDWYYDILEEDYEYNGRKIEGFVIEDSVGYMTKLKLTYYNFWKLMRAISHEAIRNGYIKKTSALTTPIANEYYAWVRKLHDVDDIDSVPKDICTLRRLFFKDKLGE